ncbi:SGNH/GDSL hydrolase family protein [Enterococcus ratti]|nr:GDSL-type esterase/lipase family protein [Enterococcus ratti]
MKKIIIFGDSIAAGLFQGEVAHILDSYLSDALNSLGKTDFTITNLGKKGDSTTSCLERLNQLTKQEKTAEYVVMNVGINDAINQRNNQETYQKNLQQMIQQFRNSHIILVGPSYVDEKIKTQTVPKILIEYGKIAKKVAESMKVDFIDFYHYEKTFEDPSLYLQEDGLHPSKLGYHFLSTLIAQCIQIKEQQ